MFAVSSLKMDTVSRPETVSKAKVDQTNSVLVWLIHQNIVGFQVIIGIAGGMDSLERLN